MEDRHPVATGALIALAVIGIILFLWFLTRVSSIIIILLLSAVLACGIAPLIDRMSRAKLPRGWHPPESLSILLVYLGLLVIVLAILGFVGSVVVREAIQLAHNAPGYFSTVTEWFGDLQSRYKWMPDLTEIADKVRSQAGAISSYAYAATGKLLGFLGNIIVVITILVLTLYMIVSRRDIRESFLSLIPAAHRHEYSETFSEMGLRMGAWLRAQVLMALIIGAAIFVGLWIIGVPYPGIIAVIGALAELVPMLGPGVAAIPAIIFALFLPTWKLIVVIVYFIILSQLESNYLTPKFMQRQVNLNPLVTILALLAGAALAGFIGALLAIPLAAALQVFVRRIVIPAINRAEGRGDNGK